MNLNEQNPPYGVSMTGKVRENNEDSFLYTNESGWLNQLAVVCDGIGGSMHGEIASRLCCQYFYEIWEEQKAMFIKDTEEMEKFMLDTLAEVNKRIYTINQSENFSESPMGTTVAAAAFMPKDIIIVHVGDSRFYECRNNGKLSCLTVDHTLLRKAVANIDDLSCVDYANSDFCNFITKSVGPTEKILDNDPKAPLLTSIKRRNDRRYILCSDGLTHTVDNERISTILKQTPDNRKAINKLISAAYSAGAIDNITIILY